MNGILKSPCFKIIVANCVGRGIGYKGQLPWNLSRDMNRFNQLTIGEGNNAIIMGGNTWESISKRSLPQRDNLILSTVLQGEHFFPSIDKIKNYCREKKYDDVWVIGGQNIYEQFISDEDVKNIYITKINKTFECDTFFPCIPYRFKLNNISDFYKQDNIPFNYQLWESHDKK